MTHEIPEAPSPDEEVSDPDEDASDLSDPGSDASLPPRQPTPVELDDPKDTMSSRRQTVSMKNQLNQDSTYTAVKNTIDAMLGNGINLPILLEAITWNNQKAIDNARIRYQRTALLHSQELPVILERWWKPPRDLLRRGGKRPEGATSTMEAFAVKVATDLIRRELKALGPKLRLPAGKDVDCERLTEAGVEEMTELMKHDAPTMWKLLY
ncbi:hypothetical protein DFP72DRAFT_811840, partial [Ephemerocybe angulata]